MQANSERDQDLFMLHQQLEGVSQPGGNDTNANSCQLEDSLPRELHTTAHANICAAFRQKPYCTFEALQPEHDDQVSKLETLANSELQLAGFDATLSTISYKALESRYAVACVEYKTSQTKRKELRDVEPEGEDDEPSQELWQVNEYTEQFIIRPIDPWDFYLSPAGSQKVEESDRIYERMWMTRSALLDGVRNEAFDEDAVKELIKGGPTAMREGFSPRSEDMLIQGIQEDVPGFYECYKATGRMPYVLDETGDNIVPEQFLDEDYVWYFCPERNICFKHTYRPYPVRSYSTGKAIGTDDQLCGHGIVSMVSAISDELTIIGRATTDSINMCMDPQMKVPESQIGWFTQNDRRGAGKYLPYRNNDPNSIQEVHRDFSGLNMGIEWGQLLYNRAQRLAAAEGVNAMAGGKQRRAAEVEFTSQVLQNKFGLMLNNLQRMVEDIFRIYMAMRKHTLPEGHTVRTGNQTREINREDFDVPYRIIPHADADNASSAARLQRDMAIKNIVMESPIFQAAIAMGDYKADWLLRNMILSHMGVPNPQSYLGPEPQDFDPVALLQGMMPIVMNGAQQGDPVAVAIIQMVQQRKQAAAQGGGGQQTSQVAPGTGLNLPVMPGSDSSAQGSFSGNGVG